MKFQWNLKMNRDSKICYICEMVPGTRYLHQDYCMCEDCFNLMKYDFIEGFSSKIIFGSSATSIHDELYGIPTFSYKPLDIEIENACDEDFRIENRKKDYQTPHWQKVGRRGRR